jgi:hypothetical protein
MRVILIVFAILLVLLTFLGAFGGSLYQKEPFFSSNSPDYMMTDSEASYPPFKPEPYENMPSMPTDDASMPPMAPKDEFYNVPSSVPSSSPMVLDEQRKGFLEDGFNIEPFEEEEPTTSLPAMY